MAEAKTNIFHSTKRETQSDNHKDLEKGLRQYVINSNVYEASSEKEHIVNGMSDLVAGWVADISSKRGLNHIRGSGAHVRLFGGGGFGVVTRGGDLDLVAIVPNFIHRTEFFTTFLSCLRNDPHTDKIRAIAEAYVPIITFKYGDTQVDMCLCVLPVSCIPADIDILNSNILDGLDEHSIRSLSGVRETSVLLSLVPNVTVFSATLQVIKIWAKRRAIHHYAMGFLGGIAWAILVAKVHQLYPEGDMLTLTSKFFKTFLEWQWPKPVLLQSLAENTLNLGQWNPKVSLADGRHVMAIITPSYPEHNAAFTTSTSTLRILQEEFARGSEIVERIEEGVDNWDDLFLPIEIEKQYKHFLVVSAHASSEDHLRDWGGLVEARIRLLTQNLERQAAVSLVHPYTISKSSTHHSDNGDTYTRRWLLGLELNADCGSRLSLAPEVKHFTDTVKKLGVERHILKPSMKVDVHHVKRKHVAGHFR